MFAWREVSVPPSQSKIWALKPRAGDRSKPSNGGHAHKRVSFRREKMHVHPQPRKLAAASAERLLPAGRQTPARAVGEGGQGGFQRPHVVRGAQRLGTGRPEQHVLDLHDVAAHALVLLPQHAHLLPLTPHHLHTAVQQSVFQSRISGAAQQRVLGHRIFKNG